MGSSPLKRSLFVSVAAAALVLAGCAPAEDVPDPPENAENTESSDLTSDSLTAAVEAALDGTGVPGHAVLVRDAEGVLASAIHGEAADDRSVEPGTVFQYRSITKSFTGTVILQLVDEGKISLDDPISDYVDGVPEGDEITIEELGAMRSGIENYSATAGLGEALGSDPSREPTVDELLAYAYPESPVFAPGSEFQYSNTNTVLLGEVIKSVTGNSWFDEVETRILQPLGIDTVSYGTDPESDTIAVGYQLADGAVVEQLPWLAPGWFDAAGALAGSVEDLAVWGEALGSGSLLEPDTQVMRLSMFGPTDDDEASPEYDRYGFAMGEIDGWVGHTAVGVGYQGLTMHDPETGRTVAILLNGTGEDPDLPAHVFKELLESVL